MLLIGDIHINAKHTKAILSQIHSYVDSFPSEKNIIFLGDYMYMFSYDRQALADLFDLFLQLWRDGKNIYIIAGNHDWLSQHFIYHEGKKVADILSAQTPNKLHFITTPETHHIEGKDVFFMPYNKGFLSNYLTDLLANSSSNQAFDLSSGSPSDILQAEIQNLLASKNYNEQLSGALNTYLLNHYKPEQTLIHHYYTADTKFPGQDAQYDYKDIALHPLWTKTCSRIISGHIHKAFFYENYFCTGSMRYTTSGERDHCKWLWRRDTQADTFHAREIAINPYVSVTEDIISSKDKLLAKIVSTWQSHKNLLPPGVIYENNPGYDLGKTTILLYTTASASDIETQLPEDIKLHVGDIQLKQVSSNNQDMSELLDMSQYNVQQSLLDRKELVKKYIMSRYGTESEKYRTLLSELGIL